MKNVMKLAKDNLFILFVIITYIVTLLFTQKTGVTGIQNSWYYIVEMLQIMPVIFILTALLDVWIPRETIMKYLGKDSKMLGLLLAFLLGSVSAGPIYTAFPICIMLLKKGASIRNVVIILSSWAVIKIPMRWILTVIAMIVIAYVMQKMIKTEELPIELEEINLARGIYIDQQFCIGCSLCSRMDPEVFYMDGKKACVKEGVDISQLDLAKLENICKKCPAKIISYVE